MKKLMFALVLVASSPALAQQPARVAKVNQPANLAEIEAAPTEDMWFYSQEMQRYNDPQEMVRRNAEYRAAQRRTRIAFRKWIGYSQQRPIVSHTPFMSSYGPVWIIDAWDPFHGTDVLPISTALGFDYTTLR